LDTAIQFIWDLLEVEELASTDVAQVNELLRRKKDQYREAWVEGMVNKSQNSGVDSDRLSWIAFHRALARRHSEAFDDDQVNPTWEMMDR
jgi:hypothetical protein